MFTYRKRSREDLDPISPHQLSLKRHISSPYAAALLLVVAIVTLGQPMVASGAVTHFNEWAQGKGNKGFSWTPTDREGNPATFVMTARSGVDSSQPFSANALGDPGTVFIEKGYKGAGVKNSDFGGSGGISGGGGDKDEELIFTYNSSVSLESIQLGLNDIEFGHGLDDKDDPVLFLSQGGSGQFSVITETDIKATSAFTYTGYKRGILDFGALSSVLGFTDIDAFAIRETRDHIYVKSLSQATPSAVPVPTPSAFFLASVGTMFSAWIHRRRNL